MHWQFTSKFKFILIAIALAYGTAVSAAPVKESARISADSDMPVKLFARNYKRKPSDRRAAFSRDISPFATLKKFKLSDDKFP
jgi:hypothetical protein